MEVVGEWKHHEPQEVGDIDIQCQEQVVGIARPVQYDARFAVDDSGVVDRYFLETIATPD